MRNPNNAPPIHLYMMNDVHIGSLDIPKGGMILPPYWPEMQTTVQVVSSTVQEVTLEDLGRFRGEIYGIGDYINPPSRSPENPDSPIGEIIWIDT